MFICFTICLAVSLRITAYLLMAMFASGLEKSLFISVQELYAMNHINMAKQELQTIHFPISCPASVESNLNALW